MDKKGKKMPFEEKESPFSEISRKFKQSPGLYIGSVIILILITVAFVFISPLSGRGIFRGSGDIDLTFGYYDKVPITHIPGNTFAQYRSLYEDYYRSQGVDLNYFNSGSLVWRPAFEMAVVDTAILQLMKRSNYSVPEKTVNKEIVKPERIANSNLLRALYSFQDNGRFSTALWNQLSNTSQRALWRQVSEELVKGNFYNDYFYNLLVPSGEAQFIGKMPSVMRSFEMVSFSVDEYPEADYLAFAHENANLFGTIHLSRITINTSEREAKRIIESINNGITTFEDAARAQSKDIKAEMGGDMGTCFTVDLQNELPTLADFNNIINLRNGEISSVIRIGDTWVFYRIEDTLKPADFDDYLTMEKVRSHIRNFERGRMEDWAIGKATEFIGDVKTSGFDDAAYSRNLVKNTFGPLPINFGGVEHFPSLQSFNLTGLTSQVIKDLSNNENFWKAAFSTQLNTPSQPLVQGSNVIVLFPTEQIEAEESVAMDNALMYSSSWVNNNAEYALQYYFLNNSRMDDRFWEAYIENSRFF